MLIPLRAVCFLSLGFIALAGCSNSLATVSGKVTLDGAPLTTGTVSFKSTSDGALGQGSIDANGNYTVSTGTASGLKPGSYQVTVVATEIDPPDPAHPEIVPIPRMLAPAKYSDVNTSGLAAEIKPGKNAGIDFELKSK